LVRHARWQAVREEIVRADILSPPSDEVRKHLSHPDIAPLISGLQSGAL
jgi:hypothetical protein